MPQALNLLCLPVPSHRDSKRLPGIGPGHQPWQGRRLPLHHSREMLIARDGF